MFRTRIYVMRWIVMLLVTAALAGTANAAPPDHAGGPNKGKPEQAQQAGKKAKPGKDHSGPAKHADQSDRDHRRDRDFRDGDRRHRDRGGVDVFFDARHRDIIRGYYGSEFQLGHCPPGLAKKRNGCMPPGQAKKWRVGHPLPGDVIYHDLPHDLERILGYDNPAYKLIRVGGDILRIGVGTGIVVEAVEDLGGLF